jgi:hypothetical protein
MSRLRKKFQKGTRPPHTYIGKRHGRITPTAKMLFDIVFYFGLGGCYMSNETLAARLNCSPRAIQLARRFLEKLELVVSAHSNPHTVTMWNRFHPAVRECKVLLYPKDQKLKNPFYCPQLKKSNKVDARVYYKAPKKNSQ